MKSITAITLLACGLLTAEAFVVPSATTTRSAPAATKLSAETGFDGEAPAEEEGPVDDGPTLPEIKGDFDWDAKFGGDDDWITEDVPGKVVLDEISLARQVTSLNALEEKYRKARQQDEIDDYQTTGWVGNAEILNSRFAMFFLAVGLFTEAFTGISMPGQVEEMLRITGFIGFD